MTSEHELVENDPTAIFEDFRELDDARDAQQDLPGIPAPFEGRKPTGEEMDALAEQVLTDLDIRASAERKEDGRAIIRARIGNAKVKLTVDLGEDGLTDWGAASTLLTLFPNIVLEAGAILEEGPDA